jgi:hypothetical protein
MKNAVFITAVLAFTLTACPGTPPPPSGPIPPAPPIGVDLLITEIGSTKFADNIAWFEVYNPTSSAINLSKYQLRALGVASTGGSASISTWTLPSFSVAAGTWVVIGGKVSAEVFDTNKSVYIFNAPSIVPFWNANGFIELTKAGATVDFVRFGTSSVLPTTASQWDNSSGPALPYTAQDFGKSIVRAPGADTNSAKDWSSRDFATPAGPNDVPAGALDADNDGIPDSAEVAGGGYNGLDLYAMGTRAGKRDLFIEVDNMTSTDPGLNPQREALDKVVAAFAARNIVMHFDTGNAFTANFNPASYNLGNSTHNVPYTSSISLSPLDGLASSVYALKAQNMDFTRNLMFHYLVLGSSQNANGTAGSSGLAELPGSDFLVSFGGWDLNRSNANNTNGLINFMAATIMHELGHNLNLHHGGDEDTNYKPNYVSIMNYEYQLNCIGGLTGASAGDRYYFRSQIKGIKTYGALSNGPIGTTCLIDYSNGSSSTLNESALNENAGLGRGNALIDWNNDGVTQTSLAFDINDDTTKTALKDANDWANLVLPFARSFNAFNNGVSTLSIKQPVLPIISDSRRVYRETPPRPEFFRRLRESMATR